VFSSECIGDETSPMHNKNPSIAPTVDGFTLSLLHYSNTDIPPFELVDKVAGLG